MKKLITAILSVFILAAAAIAGEPPALNTLSGTGSSAAITVPQATGLEMQQQRSPNLPPRMALSLRLPFTALNKRLAEIKAKEFVVADPAAPILVPAKDHIVFTNFSTNYNGIEILPTLQLKPSFKSKNLLAVKITKITATASMGPDRAIQPFSKDELVASVIETVLKNINYTIDNALKKNGVPLKAADLVSFTYEKETWTVFAKIKPQFIAPLMPGLVNSIDLANFSYDSSGFALSMDSGSGAAMAAVPSCNLIISDGMITKFVGKFVTGQDFELLPAGHDGGFKFRADGRIEFAAKAKATDLPFKPDVYFAATILPSLPAQNTLDLHFEAVDITKVYGMGLPKFLKKWLQNKIISSIVETILSDKDLAKVMTASKVDDWTVRLKIKNNALLPSFASGAVIKKIAVRHGLMYLALEF